MSGIHPAEIAFRGALASGQLRKEAAARKKAEEEAEAARKKAEEEARRKAIAAMSPVSVRLGGIRRRRVTAKRFCSCVKKVKASKKPKTNGIAICTSSLLWPHGRTLHSVSCRSRKASIKTQKRTLRKK